MEPNLKYQSNLMLHNIKKNRNGTFFSNVPCIVGNSGVKVQKCDLVAAKVEIYSHNPNIFDIFNFNSVTRCCFFTLTPL